MTRRKPSKNLSQRVNKIEHTLSRRKPEQKHHYSNINYPTLSNNSLTNILINNIGQGTGKH